MKKGLPARRRGLVDEEKGLPGRRRDLGKTKLGPPDGGQDQVIMQKGPPGARRDHLPTEKGIPAGRRDLGMKKKGLPNARRALVGMRKGPPLARRALRLERVILGATGSAGMTASMRRVRAALHKPTNAEALVIYVMHIIEKMTNNPWFPQPYPPLTKVQAAAQVLHRAQVNVQSRTRGLAEERNAALGTLSNLLEQLRVYVEGVANENLEFAQSIIESAGMDAVMPSYPQLAPFRVKLGKLPRTVDLACKAGPKGCGYDWQMSTDGGETWTNLPSTRQARTTVPGLVPGKTYWFRHRLLVRAGGQTSRNTDWSDKISIVAR
jgi:hypothetical protein